MAKGQGAGERIKKAERQMIIDWIRNSGMNPTPQQIADRFHVGYQTITRMIKTHNLKDYCEYKRTKGNKKKPIKLNLKTVKEIKQAMDNRRRPFKRFLHGGIIEFCGMWDRLGVMLDRDTQGRKIKWIKPDKDSLPDDIVIYARVLKDGRRR